MYYLDTNICIYYLKGVKSVRDSMLTVSPKDIRIPAMVKAELLYGAYKSQKKEENIRKLRAFLSAFDSEPFSDSCTEKYAALRSELERNGTPVGPNDMIIAATVIAKGGTLVTHNTKEFERINQLNVIDWVR
ncbi:MAG: type II toxin-antitoxin system VapC family toxin [Bulleidia sp.]|nr:type II toxin-antitoxin system VapC family toxin [Bulleidia sp.]